MDLELCDKVVVITGGAQGIGGAITRACLQEDAIAVIVNRDTQAAQELSVQLAQSGARFQMILEELDSPAACQRAIERATSRWGRIDAVVNNAGVNDKVGLEAGNPEAFLDSVTKNLLHYYAMAHYALPFLKAQRGSIVNIASKVALTGQGSTSGYAAAKGGQLALTREWAAELLPYGIRVNAVVPAEVYTPLYASWLKTFADPEDKLQSITSRIPLGHRMTTPEEIADAVLFLLSYRSAHTTGQWIFVDGGYVHLDRAL